MACSCIGQVSLVAMPAKDYFGEVDLIGDSHFACDARNLSSSEVCPEFTLIEANMYGFRSTPRACPGFDVLGHWEACDAEGSLPFDALNQKDFTYGPGGDIDTASPVDVTVEFLESADNKLSGYTVTLKQGDKSYTIKKEGDYLAQLTDSLKGGMAF
mmetsp:Transcript_16111/g.20463  ORF Transcript_16111/g.20463 Transcript_16111/m.20463 type:complete len:157 (+) Transcript_16111:350-820(+)